MQELRYLETEDGELTLQYKVIEPLEDGFRREVKWYDVPIVKQEKVQKKFYVIHKVGTPEFISEIRPGMGKTKHISLTEDREEAILFEKQVDARVFIEEEQLDITEYAIGFVFLVR